jgi:hypothetical protein
MSAENETEKNPTEKARRLRHKAAQVRSLGFSVWQTEVRVYLQEYANELERQAGAAELSAEQLKHS